MNRRVLWIALVLVGLVGFTATAAWAAPPGQEEGVGADALWVTLAPLIAIATFIERVLEIFWDRWEARGVWPNPAGVSNPSAPAYVNFKKMWSQWLGTFLAIMAIGLTNVRLFRLLGFDVLFSSPNLELFNLGIGGIFDHFTVGTLIDWLLTAGIIGWGGTELVHGVVEGLIKGRNLWKEMREVEAGRKSILDARFFNDYVAPELEKRGVSVTALRQAFQTLSMLGVPADEFIGSLTVGQADRFLGQLQMRPETAEAGQAIRALLEGIPPEKRAEIPNILNLLTPEQRRRFLGG